MPKTRTTRWAAIAAILLLLATSLAVVVFARAWQQRAQRDSLRASLDVLARFDVEWASEDMTKARSAAAASLLAQHPTAEVEDVLDFFDEIAYLLQRDVVDIELTWYRFYWPMANYWSASRDYIAKVRHEDPDIWENLEKVVSTMTAIERDRRKHSSPDGKPTAEQTRRFLQNEVDAGQCTDESDEETQRTPL